MVLINIRHQVLSLILLLQLILFQSAGSLPQEGVSFIQLLPGAIRVPLVDASDVAAAGSGKAGIGVLGGGRARLELFEDLIVAIIGTVAFVDVENVAGLELVLAL